jgi:hypothetical protein
VRLAVFIPAAKKNHPVLAVPPAINAVSSANINAQLRHTLAHRFRIAHIAGFDLPQSGIDASLRQSVAKSCHPLSERVSPVLFPVVDNFHHENDCSIKATIAF